MYLYEITLLSNPTGIVTLWPFVLYLYEITLLSNISSISFGYSMVLYLYEITLLSNQQYQNHKADQFCTSTKLHYSQTGQ